MATLYVVATPIGNLGDFSPRGVETLKTADWIAAEDTRVTMKLCQVFDIHTPLTSCHRHNEDSKSDFIVRRMLEENLTVALTTDAGTPGISDPGHELVQACVEAGISVIPVPGCCAAAAAVSISGFDAREFTFWGFLPREKKDLREKLQRLREGTRVAVVHESPFRVMDLVEAIGETLPGVRLAVCCDLTKLHEKTLYGDPETVLAALRSNPKAEKGEYCLVLDLHEVPGPDQAKTAAPDLSAEAMLVETCVKEGLSLREAQERLAAEGWKKNEVKRAALALKKMFL